MHDRLDALRRACPAHMDVVSGTVLVTGMVEAKRWLSDPLQWKDADRAEDGALVRRFKPADMNRAGERDAGIVWMDEPDHSRVRQPLQAALARRVANSLSDMERIVEERLAALSPGGFDVVADFAAPLPIAGISHLLGVEVNDFARFRAWSEAALNTFNPAPTEAEVWATKGAAEAVLRHLDRMVAERRSTPRDDLVSDLVTLQQAGAPISDAEIVVNCLNLMLGGNVTTADLIASAVWLLLSHRDQLARLRGDPALLGSAVEEVLRFEPPGDGAQRVAAFDHELAGCPVRARQVVAVLIPAANRDPRAFPDPHRFDIGRRDGPHISFGAGAHVCIGAHFARLLTRTALAGLLDRFKDLRLVEPEAAPRWREDRFFRGLATLPVRV